MVLMVITVIETNAATHTECVDAVAAHVGRLVLLLLVNFLLSLLLLSVMVCLYNCNPRTENSRLVLHRLVVFTANTPFRSIYVLTSLIDALSVVAWVYLLWLLWRSADVCPSNFVFHLRLVALLQSVVFIRLVLFCVHFPFHKAFWRACKRKFAWLGVVEHEQRLVLEVYSGPAYLNKIKRHELSSSLTREDEVTLHAMALSRRLSMGVRDQIRSMQIDDMECSICLDNILSEMPPAYARGEDSNSNTGAAARDVQLEQVVALPCNVLHFFHPECIQEWLLKSAACPLCKVNAFTQEIEPDQSPAEV